MIINKAILHIFDFISEVCIFSQKEIDLREDNINEFCINQMIISKNPQFTGISARQQLEFTTHLLLTD